MTLPGTIVWRANEFSQPDYSVIYKDPDGRELSVGRLFRTTITNNTPVWFRSVGVSPAQGPSRTASRSRKHARRGKGGMAQVLGFGRRADTLAAIAAEDRIN